MKIATHNSEKLLLADLREARIGNPTHRCLLLRLSKAEESMNTWLPRLERSLRHTLGEAINQVYLTHDQDVFIYGWGITQTLVQDLMFDLSETLSGKTLQGLIHLYEIGVHWDELESMCVAKVRAFEEKQKQEKSVKQNNELEKISTDDAFKAMDTSLIQSIDKRRSTRKEAKILIVEDDIFSQTLIQKALNDKYDLALSDDGQGAILGYVKVAPDIMFLDIELPDINGHDVLKKIKMIDKNAYVVMFSGNGDRENILKALDLGAQGFVGKPFAKEKLIQYIEKSPFIKHKTSAQNAINAQEKLS